MPRSKLAETRQSNEKILLKKFVENECIQIKDNDPRFPYGNEIERVSDLLKVYQQWHSDQLKDLSSNDIKNYMKTLRIGSFTAFLHDMGFESVDITNGRAKSKLISKWAYDNRRIPEKKQDNRSYYDKKHDQILAGLTDEERYDIEYKYKLSITMYCKIKAHDCFEIFCYEKDKIDYEESRMRSVKKYYDLHIKRTLRNFLDDLRMAVENYKHNVRDIPQTDPSCLFFIDDTNETCHKYLMITEHYHIYEALAKEFRERLMSMKKNGTKIMYELMVYRHIDSLNLVYECCQAIRTKLSSLVQGCKKAQQAYTPERTVQKVSEDSMGADTENNLDENEENPQLHVTESETPDYREEFDQLPLLPNIQHYDFYIEIGSIPKQDFQDFQKFLQLSKDQRTDHMAERFLESKFILDGWRQKGPEYLEKLQRILK